jgi:ATP phosphoribosyltransferase regulatory subunit
VVRRAVLALPRLAGDADVLAEAEAHCLNTPMMAALADLASVARLLAAYGVTDAVAYDLAEVRDLDYYTGVTFEGFAPGIGFSLISGGRYDDLIGHFGPSFPAVGWALTLDRILLARELQGFKHEAPCAHVLLSANGCSDCLGWARAAREVGISVMLDLGQAEPDALWQQAQDTGTPRIILHRHGSLLARAEHGERRYAAGDWAEVEAWLRS